MDPLAAYADYVEGSLRLMIHYARHLTSRRNPPVPMAEALETRTDILRKTAHFDGRHPAYGLEPRNAAAASQAGRVSARDRCEKVGVQRVSEKETEKTKHTYIKF